MFPQKLCLAIAVGGLIFTAADAADVSERVPVKAVVAPPASAWSFYFTPYFWAPSITGTSTIRGRSLDIDASFIDIARRSEIPKDLFGLMGAFEARRGPWSLYADLVYMRLGASESGARVVSVNPAVGGALAVSASARFKMFIGEFGAAYEVFGTAPDPAGSATAIDIYAGGRVWWQQAEASLALTAGLTIGDLTVSGGRAIARSGDVSWLDPLIGVRLRHRFSPATEFVIRGDIGGFGAGSEFSWQAVGTINWDFARTESVLWTAVLGYRALYADFSRGNGATLYRYDILMHGPVFGVTAKF
jgi:hypothetical protein